MTEPQSPLPAALSMSTSASLSWGVAALLLASGDALAARFGSVTVRGELSGVARAASGHCYFSLKDSDGAPALLRCAMFRRAAAMIDFQPADGQQVELRGRLSIYEPRGELQMVAEAMQRLGTGTLYEEFLRRRARLQSLGLFEAARKRVLPRHPRAVGVVTSTGAAALHDVLTALQRRAPHLRVVVYPSLVQGADAPAALVAALAVAGARQEVDVLLLVRGGGSLEDLWAFNDERVVQAVAACPLPVICGVGHETDITLCDLVADLRAATPTAAAERVALPRDDLLADLDARNAVLQRALLRRLQTAAQRLDQIGLRLGQPARGLSGQQQALAAQALRLRRGAASGLQQRNERLTRTADRVQRAMQAQLLAHANRLQGSARHLQANDPAGVLKRGYAWIESADGRPVVSVRALRPGQAVQAVWADGRAQADIVSVQPLTPAGD